MKKILMYLLLVFITAGLCFAASSKEEITQDLNLYNSDINPKIVDALSKMIISLKAKAKKILKPS